MTWVNFVVRGVAICIAFSVAVGSGARAQLLQGTIDGNVVDSSQAAVLGAKVTAKSQQTNFVREAVTNTAGAYDLPGLPPETYTITVTAPGFQNYVQTGVSVTPNTIRRVNATLTVGQVTETLTVEASAQALQTDRSEIRSDVTGNTLTNIPVVGRNYQLVVATLPGVSPAQNGNSFAANPSRSVNFSANGTPTNINSTRIDGVASGGIIDSTLTYLPALEAIAEVNVVTNAFDAEQGLAGGAAVSLTIKSGSNSIHGSGLWFHTDQHFKAYQWAADRTQPKPKYINNQMGATLGGPIKKDKMFYFLSFENTGYSESASKEAQVPTLAMQTGNLSASPAAIYDPLTGNADGTGRTPFEGKIIPANRIDPGVKNFLNLGGWGPNQPGGGAFGLSRNFVTSAPNYQWRRQYDEKFNWNPTDRLSTFVRFGMMDHNANTNGVFGALGGKPISRANTGAGFVQGHLFQGTISATYVVTPSLIVDGAYGYFREDFNDLPPRGDQNLGFTVFQVPGLQTTDKRELGWPLILIDGFEQIGAPNNFEPHGYRDPVRDYVGNLSWNKGSHNLRFGTDINFQDINESQPQGSNSYTASPGGFQFSQGTTQLKGGPKGSDYNAFASFLLGLPINAGKTRQFPEEIQQRMRAYSFYARDRWQVTPKLTVNYGLRYERFPFPRRVGRGLEIYDFTNNTMKLCGLGPNPIDCGISNGKGRPAPRAGIAYRLNDTVVIRAGYGMTNDPINYANFQRLNYPDLSQQVLNAPNSFSYATTLRTGFAVPVAPNLSSGIVTVPNYQNLITFDNANLVRGYIQSWNFTVEKQFSSWIGSAGYVATRSVDQLSQLDQNWSPIGGGTAGEILNRKFGRTAPTFMLGTLGTAKYDSLQARVEHRMANGFHVAAGYTYAHGSGYTSESSGASPQIGIPYLYDRNYGLLTRDIRQNLNITWILESPFGRQKRWLQNGFAGKIAGGWQLSGVISAYNGQPFTVTASNTSLNAPASSQRANCNSTPTKLGDNLQFYDKSAFSGPAVGTLGNCGYNNLVGPGVFNLDLGLDRKFQLTERFELKFRAEAFNAANTPHHANPNSTQASVSNSSFMQVTDIRNTGRDGLDERTFRVGLRLAW